MLIENGIVFTGKEFLKGLTVRLQNGIVNEVGEKTAADNGECRIDLEGDYLLPGFVDVHIHAFRGSDTMRGETDVRRMSRELAKSGTGAFCPTTMSASEADTRNALAGIRAVMDRPERNGARVLGAHMEAPFLSEGRAGAQLKQYFTDPDWLALKRMAEDTATVRLMTMAPERNGSEAFIRQATAAGIRISVGHDCRPSARCRRLGRRPRDAHVQRPDAHPPPGARSSRRGADGRTLLL